MSTARLAKSHYRHNQYVTQPADDNPVERLQVLLKGLLDTLYLCEGAVEAGDTVQKGEQIGRCMDIFIALKQSLTFEYEGHSLQKDIHIMSQQLDQLYDHCLFLLSRTTLENDLSALAAVQGVVRSLLEGWQSSTGTEAG